MEKNLFKILVSTSETGSVAVYKIKIKRSIIIKGVRESTLSGGKSHARNPTQNPTANRDPNQAKPHKDPSYRNTPVERHHM